MDSLPTALDSNIHVAVGKGITASFSRSIVPSTESLSRIYSMHAGRRRRGVEGLLAAVGNRQRVTGFFHEVSPLFRRVTVLRHVDSPKRDRRIALIPPIDLLQLRQLPATEKPAEPGRTQNRDSLGDCRRETLRQSRSLSLNCLTLIRAANSRMRGSIPRRGSRRGDCSSTFHGS